MTDTPTPEPGPLPTPKHDVRVTIGGTSFAFTVDEARDVMCRVEDAPWNAQPIMEADVRRSELLSLWRQEIAKRQDFERRLAEAEERNAELAQERARHEAEVDAHRNEAHAASLALEAGLAARYEGVVAELRGEVERLHEQEQLTRRERDAARNAVQTWRTECERRNERLAASEAALAESVATCSKAIARGARAELERDHAIEMEARAVLRAEQAEEARERAERERDEERHLATLRGEMLAKAEHSLVAEKASHDADIRAWREQRLVIQAAHEETRRDLEKAKRNTVTSTAFRRLFRTKEAMGAALRKEVAKLRASRDRALHMEGEMRSAVYEETARADMAERQRDEAREALAKAEERAYTLERTMRMLRLVRAADFAAAEYMRKTAILRVDTCLSDLTTQPQTDPSTSAPEET